MTSSPDVNGTGEEIKIGIIIATNDAETCWNALRYGNFCLGQNDAVKVFLIGIGKGVEYQKTSTEKSNIVDQANQFIQSGGKIYACGTCIKARQQEVSELCPVSTMKDMYGTPRASPRYLYDPPQSVGGSVLRREYLWGESRRSKNTRIHPKGKPGVSCEGG